MHTYQAQVRFTFLDQSEDEHNHDSETFEVQADSKAEAFMLAFNRTINNWDNIGITEVSLA